MQSTILKTLYRRIFRKRSKQHLTDSILELAIQSVKTKNKIEDLELIFEVDYLRRAVNIYKKIQELKKTNMKISDHFTIQEFVPKSIYEKFGDSSTWFMDERIINFCEWMRVKTGKRIMINTWASGGHLDDCGYREPDCKSGARLSQHKFGRAVDLHIEGMEPEEVREIIRENFTYLREKFGITTMEKDTPSWIHVDCRYTTTQNLLEVPYM